MANFLSTTASAFSRELAGHLAARLGESEKGLAKALTGAVRVVLEGLISKARLGEEDAVFEMSRQAYALANSTFGTLTGMLGMVGSGDAADSDMTRGEVLLAVLFGSSNATLAEEIAGCAGIKPRSARQLLRLVAAAMPALLGQYAHNHSLTASGLLTALLKLRTSLRALSTQGLGLSASLLAAAASSSIKSQQQALPIYRRMPAMERRVPASVATSAWWYSAVLAAFMLLSVYVTSQSVLLAAGMEHMSLRPRVEKTVFNTKATRLAGAITKLLGAVNDAVQ
jgi:hypothetical protein